MHTVSAEVRLPHVFGDHMVLQCGREIPVWGWADPGERVSVVVNGKTSSAVAGKDSTWSVKVGPLEPGGPYSFVCTGKNRIEYSDVLAGEVWIASGQSNMEMRVRHVNDALNELANALHRDIRLFQPENNLSTVPLKDIDARWEICRPSTVNSFSAAAYFFARTLHDSLNVPVGIIHSSWGGTTIEAWMRSEIAATSPDYRKLFDRWSSTLAANRDSILAYYRIASMWEEDVHDAEYVGKRLGYYTKAPASDPPLGICPSMPAWNYNAMIAPLVPFAIRGAIWYQGESNAGRAYQYRTLFPELIADWRKIWGNDSLAFCYVQLANYMQRSTVPGNSSWAELREAQFMTLTVPNTAMAVAIDIGLADNVHPLNKQEVGRRLALGALKSAYGKSIVSSGPLYDSMAIADGKIHLRFSSIGGGLATSDSGPLKGFVIAGEDRKFVWAEAAVQGNEVVVWSASVKQPVAVRYAWADNPECNLINREGLPASPFRTDNWPGITAGKEF